MRILFIEDEAALAEVGTLQLRQLGHEVATALTLDDASRKLQEPTGFDAIIADHRMPDGWGIEFLLNLREAYPGLMMCIVSGCLTPEDVAEMQSRDLPFYRKPLLYSNVIKDLRRRYPPTVRGSDSETDEQSAPPPHHGKPIPRDEELPPPPAPPGPKAKGTEEPQPKRGLTSFIFGRK